MVTHRWAQKFLGQHVQCHTPYGTFHGVVIHATKHHIILGSIATIPPLAKDDASSPMDFRQFPMGPGGHPGPGGPGGPGGGGGWHMAIPLAAILGITALGLHWW